MDKQKTAKLNQSDFWLLQSMEIGKIKNVTLDRTPTDKYFAVLNVEFEPVLILNNGRTIGIDVGIKEFYTNSNRDDDIFWRYL